MGGNRKRLVLQSDRSILSMFEYAAYQEYRDKIVVDAFGEYEAGARREGSRVVQICERPSGDNFAGFASDC